MAINLFTMALMPISQSVAWYLVVTGSATVSTASLHTFYSVIRFIAGFYCAWALYNRYLGGNVRELGQYSMGILTICTHYHQYVPSVVATGLVLSNFLLPSYFILVKWNATELARNVKNDTSRVAVAWAVVFKVYFISNLCLWSYVFYKFYTYRESSSSEYTVLPVTTTTTNTVS